MLHYLLSDAHSGLVRPVQAEVFTISLLQNDSIKHGELIPKLLRCLHVFLLRGPHETFVHEFACFANSSAYAKSNE
jgi:hypothetical protein